VTKGSIYGGIKAFAYLLKYDSRLAHRYFYQ